MVSKLLLLSIVLVAYGDGDCNNSLFSNLGLTDSSGCSLPSYDSEPSVSELSICTGYSGQSSCCSADTEQAIKNAVDCKKAAMETAGTEKVGPMADLAGDFDPEYQTDCEEDENCCTEGTREDKRKPAKEKPKGEKGEGEKDGEKVGNGKDGETDNKDGDKSSEKRPSGEKSEDTPTGDKNNGERSGDKNSDERSGDKNGERSGDKNGEKSGDKNGERSGDKNGETSGDKNGERSGDKNGERSGDKNGERSGDKNSGERSGDKPKGEKPKNRRLEDEEEKGPKGCRGKNKQRKGLKELDESDKEKCKKSVEEGKKYLKDHEQKMGKCIKGMMKYTSAMLCSGCSTDYDSWVQVNDNGDTEVTMSSDSCSLLYSYCKDYTKSARDFDENMEEMSNEIKGIAHNEITTAGKDSTDFATEDLDDLISGKDVCADDAECEERVCKTLLENGGGIESSVEDLVDFSEDSLIKGGRRLSGQVTIVYASDASFSPMEDSEDVDVEITVEIDGQPSSDEVADDTDTYSDDFASVLGFTVAFALLA